MNSALHDRTLGALYGVALGDAMGMPGELWSRRRIQATFGRITGLLPAPGGHDVVDGFVAGQVTDDTQQAVMLAESIIRAGGRVDPPTFAVDLVDWADRVGASDRNYLGPTSAKVIALLRSGAPWHSTGVAGTTNGAAMRIAPVGLLCPSDYLGALVAEVEASCAVSHGTNVAIAGAAMIATAVSTGVDAPAGERRATTVTRALDAARVACALGMERGVDVAGASLLARTELAVQAARSLDTDDEFLQYVYDVVGGSTETTESVPAALGIVARAGGDPVRSALLSANLGADTDTIGAMAGGICGAIAGYAAIPAHYIETLDAVNDLPFAALASSLEGFRLARSAGAPA